LPATGTALTTARVLRVFFGYDSEESRSDNWVLPKREREQVFEYVDAAIEPRENQIDIEEARKALADAQSPVSLNEFLKKHGLD
jgi:hypothetical protein